MKKEIIKKLKAFDQETYQRLYIAFSYDIRFSVFECYSHDVDAWFTFKNKNTPEHIYNLLCNNKIKSWNIDEKILHNTIHEIR